MLSTSGEQADFLQQNGAVLQMRGKENREYTIERKLNPEHVPIINKRVLGKKIVSLCGNEGTEDDSNNAGLRRLLQLAITVTEGEIDDVLKNAEFKFYDDKCNIYVIKSGDAQQKFIFMFDEKFEPLYSVQRTCGGIIKQTIFKLISKLYFLPEWIFPNVWANIPFFYDEYGAAGMHH